MNKKTIKNTIFIVLFSILIANSNIIYSQNQKTNKLVRHRVRLGYDMGRKMEGIEILGPYLNSRAITPENDPGNGFTLNYVYNFWDYYKEYPGILTFGLMSEVGSFSSDTTSMVNGNVGLEVFAAGLTLQTGFGYVNFGKPVNYIEGEYKNAKIIQGEPNGTFWFAKLGLDIPMPKGFGLFCNYCYYSYPGDLLRKSWNFGISKKIKANRK